MLNKWIDWDGGDCPVPMNTEVKIQMRDGSEAQDYAGRFRWDHLNFLGDILKYQVLPTLPAARDRINKIKETIAKLEKERAELLDFIRSEGFVLVDETSVSKIDVTIAADMSDPRNWQVGDVLKCIREESFIKKDYVYKIDDGLYDYEEDEVNITDRSVGSFWRPSSCFKWHSRPPKL